MARTGYWKQRYHNFKDKGLCVKCGKPKDSEYTLCESCRQKSNAYVRETRKVLQSLKICPRCRKNELYGDEKQCPECAAKAYACTMLTRENEHYNETHRIWAKKQYEIDKEKGICPRCRKRVAADGYVTCAVCREKDKNRKSKDKKPNRGERYLQGLCYYCDNPVKKGYKVCEYHYQLNVKNARSQKANEARKKLLKDGVLY